MAFLFDTDAISESFKRRPLAPYLARLRTVPCQDQFTSAFVVGELFKGAFRSGVPRHLENIERRVLPEVTILPYDARIARRFGSIQAQLEATGDVLSDADAVIAATALYHDLELVTGNIRHFVRVAGLRISAVLSDARRDRS